MKDISFEFDGEWRGRFGGFGHESAENFRRMADVIDLLNSHSMKAVPQPSKTKPEKPRDSKR